MSSKCWSAFSPVVAHLPYARNDGERSDDNIQRTYAEKGGRLGVTIPWWGARPSTLGPNPSVPWSYWGLQHPYHPSYNVSFVSSPSYNREKPSQSYIGLIAEAILSSAQHQLILSDIYGYILTNYPYFRAKGTGWRNSIRHNLSLNDCFVKAGRSPNGKGHFWAIDAMYFEDFKRGDFRRRRTYKRYKGRKCARGEPVVVSTQSTVTKGDLDEAKETEEKDESGLLSAEACSNEEKADRKIEVRRKRRCSDVDSADDLKDEAEDIRHAKEEMIAHFAPKPDSGEETDKNNNYSTVKSYVDLNQSRDLFIERNEEIRDKPDQSPECLNLPETKKDPSKMSTKQRKKTRFDVESLLAKDKEYQTHNHPYPSTPDTVRKSSPATVQEQPYPSMPHSVYCEQCLETMGYSESEVRQLYQITVDDKRIQMTYGYH